jgi:hypothetical protein
MAAQSSTIYAAGGVVLELLESAGFQPTPRSSFDTWVNRYGLQVVAGIDPPAERVTRTLMTYGVRESMFVVDLRTMRIVNKYNGSVAGVPPSSVIAATARILELLRSGM